jgi:hypothetical protein
VATGGKTPMKTIAKEAFSPIPKAKITKGIHAIGGGNLGASKIKLKRKFFLRKTGN